MTEIVDGIAWTPEMRARIAPSRKIQNPAFRDARLAEIDLLEVTPDATRAWAAHYWKLRADDAKRAKGGLANNPPAWRPAVEAALARCKKPKQDHPLDIDVEVATVTLDLCPVAVALPYWVAAGGLPFALRTMIRCHEHASSEAKHPFKDPPTKTWILDTSEYSVDRPYNHVDAWSLLRALLAEAIEPIYDETHGVADEARLRTATGSLNESGLQLMLPFAFPDEEAWAAAAAPTAIGLASQPKRGYTEALVRYVSVAPIDTACELLSATPNGRVTTTEVLTICAHRGAAAGLRVVEAAAIKASNDHDRKIWCQFLLAFRTPEATKLFERLAKRGQPFAAFADKHRQLVVPAKPAKKKRRR